MQNLLLLLSDRKTRKCPVWARLESVILVPSVRLKGQFLKKEKAQLLHHEYIHMDKAEKALTFTALCATFLSYHKHISLNALLIVLHSKAVRA